jgi:hypothetical protein
MLGDARRRSSRVGLRLREKYGERRSEIVFLTPNAIAELFTNPHSGTWTILRTDPHGKSCMPRAGKYPADAVGLPIPANPFAKGRLYDTEAWRCRAKRQLELEPLCRVCLAQARIDVARVADHVRDHKRDLRIFWEANFSLLYLPQQRS